MLQITEYPVHFQLLDTVTCRGGDYESYVSELITSRWLSGADLPGAIPPPYMAASQKSRRQVDQKHVSSVPECTKTRLLSSKIKKYWGGTQPRPKITEEGSFTLDACIVGKLCSHQMWRAVVYCSGYAERVTARRSIFVISLCYVAYVSRGMAVRKVSISKSAIR